MKDKEAVLKRLKRIEGQVRGLEKMVEEDRYCADVLMQMASVEQAIGSAAQVVLKSHLHTCVAAAVKGAKPGEAERKFDEIVMLFGRHWR
ncbi:MAG TPA: metal-sensitive transcriptional regulator [Bryobacteraceae bacterium]|nr:metal-sensitive transcriptional regulator [Bryobacteraceae bacterium]HPT27682.1 metal-sensitive transcriptional regulator [Bryobacteraceae bacterium]